MKRFYKEAQAGTAPGGFVVRLDGKLLKTPLQHPLLLPSKNLAAAIADEWQAQDKELIPDTMPLTQLGNAMIDKARGHDRTEMNQTLLDYASSDLLCYFATHPKDLVGRQEELWLPLLEYLAAAHHIHLEKVSGIQYHQQSEESLNKLAVLIEQLSPEVFTVTQAVAGATGSFVIALALAEGEITAEAAFTAACVDEIFQLEKWGEDELARTRLNRIQQDIETAEKFSQFMKKA